MTHHDVLVRGAGAVGLATALALSRQGLRVALLGDLTEPARPDVRAYALNAASVRLLAELKVWVALPADARTAVHDMHVEGDSPGATLDFSAWQQSLGELAWIVDTAELERALRAAVRFAPHVTVVAAPVPAALQVAAEGKDSAAREAWGVRMPRHGYGQRAVAARLSSDRPHAGLARQWFRSPDVLALLPLDRPVAGHGLALVWSLPEAEAQRLTALSDADFTAALNDATAGAAGTLTLVGPRASWSLSLARAERLCGPGWVLVGDAAHVVHPLAGQGLNLGLADVEALARVLAGREAWRALGDERLLARYARERLGPVRAMAGITDGLLHLFAHPSPLARELRNRGLTLVNRLAPLKRALAGRALG
jgi:2-polyprenyl-6-methoxyphenol hydroxylase-like FAD-dependent oxidoreductase